MARNDRPQFRYHPPPMTDRSALVQRLFLAACRVQGAERAAVLDAECRGDAALRREVEDLLRLDAGTPFLDEDDLRELRAPLAAPAPLPDRIAGFRILSVLGSGGMGVVYRAEQANPPRQVALKVLAPGLGDAAARSRFALEAEALGRLQHPGIAQILQAGTYTSPAGEQPFLAMELIDGEALPDWAARTRPGPRAALQLLIEICAAVQHAHQKGLIHRDLKPGNVFVDRQGRAKVLDFGIARFVDGTRTLQTMTGQVLGTLAYMSPEQANGHHDRIDVRTDVYALGVIGYELLAGALPIDVQGAPFTTALRRLVEEEPLPLGQHDRRLRGDLQTIFAMALRKEPHRRYGSAQALADDLQRYLAHEPILARPATTIYLVQQFARRHRGLVAGGVLAGLALVLGTVVSLAWAVRAEAAERQAKAEARVANRTVEFVRGLFAAAAPRVALGQTITARDLVAEGSRNIGRDLADEPVLRARLAGLLGNVLIELGDHTTAEPMLSPRAVPSVVATTNGWSQRSTISAAPSCNWVASTTRPRSSATAWRWWTVSRCPGAGSSPSCTRGSPSAHSTAATSPRRRLGSSGRTRSRTASRRPPTSPTCWYNRPTCSRCSGACRRPRRCSSGPRRCCGRPRTRCSKPRSRRASATCAWCRAAPPKPRCSSAARSSSGSSSSGPTIRC